MCVHNKINYWFRFSRQRELSKLRSVFVIRISLWLRADNTNLSLDNSLYHVQLHRTFADIW